MSLTITTIGRLLELRTGASVVVLDPSEQAQVGRALVERGVIQRDDVRDPYCANVRERV